MNSIFGSCILERIQDRVVIISDVHIREASDARAQILYSVCERIDVEKVEYFLLLGDIFDFCYGSSSYFKNKFSQLGQVLEHLAEQGVKVIYFQGNHEFSMRDIGWKGVEFIDSKDYSLNLDNDISLLLSHGDSLHAPWHYSFYLFLTRSRLFAFLGLMAPQSLLDKFCLSLSKKSRKMSHKKEFKAQNILDSLSKWFSQNTENHAVVGHFHFPLEHFFSNHRRILCLNSWDKPNALGFDGTNFFRYFFSQVNGNVQINMKSVKSRSH